ncbi:hypothetical protein VPNG_08105 [Cytospora leucostoma]|uniref:Pheromone-regulated membrane protein n=1 Tax=Cytospora leucostoma TaxID=1230097 RepID=A0A423WSR5_9PEZI|nr:hypothetical protein VPNG_08105 [Cytospora leucostoma]
MGCMSHRRSDVEVRPEQKWDYISLNDFKAESAFTYIAYGYLFFSLIISTAVYAVDTFTAVNLLAFNKWSSEIQPAVSFDITKWIFAICIILSIVNLVYEHIRALRIMRRGSVAESYLDNLAVKLESIRMGSGKGWRRFLVFAELTKSKKGAEYIALFTYFSFQSWIRVIFCAGPRQAVNGITLYSVYTAKLAVSGENFESSFVDFFDKIKALAEQDYQQALILSGMVFTVVVWAFSFLSLLIATMFFVFFLWGWIPQEDGGLSGYCERKINKRLMSIVSTKIDAAIADQERQRKKAELRAAKKAGEMPPEERKATLPRLMPDNDKIPGMPMINRNDTMATLPLYTSRPGTPNGGGGQGFELNKMPVLNRTGTASSTSSRAPLLQSGAEMGRSSPAPPLPPLPPLSTVNYSMGPPLQRMQTDQSSFGGPYTQTPTAYSPDNDFPPMPQPVRSFTSAPMGPYGMPPRSNTTPAPRATFNDEYPAGRASPAPLRQMPSRSTFDDYNDGSILAPSAIPPSVYPPRGQTQSPRPMAPSYGQRGYPGGPGVYPMRNATGPLPNRGPPGAQPQRNMTAPGPQPGIQRQGTGEFRSLTPAQQSYRGAQPPRNMSAPSPQADILAQSMGEIRSHSPAQQDQYNASSGYFEPPASQPDAYYSSSPPDEYLNRPSTAQSQRSIGSPPQLNRQPTYGSERDMNSPPQLRRQPTNESVMEMASPPQLRRQSTHQGETEMNSPAHLRRQPTYGSEQEIDSPPQLRRQPTYGSEQETDSPLQLRHQPTYEDELEMDSPTQLRRQPTYGSEQEMNSPAQLVRQPTYGSEQSMSNPRQPVRKPTYGSGWMTDLEGQRGSPGPQY